MPQRCQHRRAKTHLPALCRIQNRRDEIILSSAGQTNTLSLGGMHLCLPVHLIIIRTRLIEDSVDLPEPFAPREGTGVVPRGFWGEENWQTTLGLEMSELPGDQWAALENLMVELAEDESTPFFQSLNN